MASNPARQPSNRWERLKRPFAMGTQPAFIFFQRLFAQRFNDRFSKDRSFGTIGLQTVNFFEG